MKIWEIWFAKFPFEEDPSIEKERPVIILNVEPLEVLSVKVTSHKVRNEDEYDIAIEHWQEAGLRKPSVARISKAMFLDNNKFEYKIGTLHDDDKVSIFTKYKEYIARNN